MKGNKKCMKLTDILVIGNGFDLWCKLRSRYTDFAKERRSGFDSFYNSLDSFLKQINEAKPGALTKEFFKNNIKLVIKEYISELNFWEIFFEIANFKRSDDILWLNIEQDIHTFMESKSVNSSSYGRLQQIFKSGVDLDSIPSTVIGLQTTIDYLLFFIMMEQKVLDYTSQSDDIKDSINILSEVLKHNEFGKLARYLLNELNRFEKTFCIFLQNQVRSNARYNDNASNLVNIVTNELSSNLSNSAFREVYYMNFNYTLPSVKQFSKNGTNVHGYIGDDCDEKIGEIIIGIDHEQFEANSPVYAFTKTYRKLFLRQKLISQPLPPREVVKRIIFFGHSYGKADYSYFRSVFDYYDIEKSDVQLIFNYCVYNEQSRDEICHNQYKSVSNLLNDYSKNANTQAGKNLTHRLLLEHRLTIREIENNSHLD
jgi:hypothetical protein